MKKYSIGTRLTLTFSALLVLAMAIGVSAILGMNGLVAKLETATGASVKKIDLANQFNTVTSDMLVYQRGMYLAAYENDRPGVEAAKSEFRALAEKANQLLRNIEPLLVSPDGKRIMGSLKDQMPRWLAAFPELERLCLAGEAANAAKRGRETTFQIFQDVSKGATELVGTSQALIDEERSAAASQVKASMWLIWGSLGLFGLVGIGAFLIIRNLSNELRQTAGEVSEMASQVAGAAGQVSSASQSLAQGASEQAATLEETSASGEELTSMTLRNTESTATAADLMTDVDRQVSNANKTLEHMVVSMNEINASADKISKIIKVIDEIAFQTNILALNAAVEAARAGDAGMGFAVVADEVRSLAQRCAQAARDTAQLIEESITRSGEGKERLRQVAQAIDSITGGAAKVSKLIQDVSSGSREQSTGMEQINKAIAQMERVTQSSAATAEESAASSEELSAMAQAMKNTADQLSVLVGLQQKAVSN
ncbi:MAG: methyl-accepting chemotaxis protein [Bryobacteraceae bacterium]|nr:methyl-accepting chemotaxis protein [Bryobacteraceae bacterium]